MYVFVKVTLEDIYLLEERGTSGSFEKKKSDIIEKRHIPIPTPIISAQFIIHNLQSCEQVC
jgi:hypothetical protein